MTILSTLHTPIKTAMIQAGADETTDPVIKQSGKPQFGDYQANGVMGVAKKNWA
ncbi:hypothetical protein LU293_07750 [Moraxella nasovis]|uniref:hypothetical protein n=1 Tax=Moraxella nasovis TaxID=2904121 RepID=UPI001F616705|nr:hypothetical protein [Moraxella nasovis]UNU72972.1 hypothetical protein LU293_07750 [Moraxella nasovis]